MFIYWKKPNGSKEEIHGPNDSIDNIYGQLVDVLGVGSCSNMFNLLKAIAEYELPSPKGYLYSAWVERVDPGVIGIWYTEGNIPDHRTILVANLEADVVTPDYFRETIKEYVLASLKHTGRIVSDGISALLLPVG